MGTERTSNSFDGPDGSPLDGGLIIANMLGVTPMLDKATGQVITDQHALVEKFVGNGGALDQMGGNMADDDVLECADAEE